MREKGPLYRIPTNTVYSMGFAATSLGVARAHAGCRDRAVAQEDAAGPFRDAREQRGAGPDRPHRGQLRRDARLSLRDRHRGLATTWCAATPSPKRIASRCGWPRPGPFIKSTEIVDTAYHMAGATAVFSANAFERRFRDMHTIASSSRPATPITRISARRSCRASSPGRRRRDENLREKLRSQILITSACLPPVILRASRLPVLLSNFWEVPNLPLAELRHPPCSNFDRSRLA